MKIIIAKTTVAAAGKHTADLMEAVTGRDSLVERIALQAGVLPQYTLRHQSLTYISGEGGYVYEIDDALLLRVMALYVKAARLLAPIVRSFLAVAKTLQSEVKAIEAMANAEAEETAVL